MNFLQNFVPHVSRLVLRDIRSVQQLRYMSSENPDKVDPDAPIFDMENPFKKPKKECYLCANKIEVDYKNVRLLSKFVSPYTGKLYEKNITGLCETQQRILSKQYYRALRFGLMSPFYRDPKYNNDPPLFNPNKPQRPNPY